MNQCYWLCVKLMYRPIFFGPCLSHMIGISPFKLFDLRSSMRSFERSPIHSGSFPDRLFLLKSRISKFLQFRREMGIFPLNMLRLMCNTWSLFSCPSSTGICPWKPLFARFNTLREEQLPNCEGSWPERLLSERSSACSWYSVCSQMQGGIFPSSLFDAKNKELEDFNTVQNSKGSGPVILFVDRSSSEGKPAEELRGWGKLP